MDLAEHIKSLFFSFGEHERKPNEIYVSDLCSCLRKAWFELRFNANPKPSGPMVAGKLFHALLKQVLEGDELFKNAEFEVECKEELGSGWVLKGRADVVAGDTVYEFKFTRGLNFNKAHPNYYMQVGAYCFMLGKPKGCLVLVDRESFDTQVLESEPDDDLWSNLKEEAKLLVSMVEKGEVPTLNSPRFDFECKNCLWDVICSKMNLGVKPVEPGK